MLFTVRDLLSQVRRWQPQLLTDFLRLMAMTKLKRGLIVLVVGGGAITLVIQLQTDARLREEIQSLRRRMSELQAENESLSYRSARAKSARSPRLPASPMQANGQT